MGNILNEDKKIYQMNDQEGDSMGLLQTDCYDFDLISEEWEKFMANVDEMPEFDTDIESFIQYMILNHDTYEFDRVEIDEEINC